MIQIVIVISEIYRRVGERFGKYKFEREYSLQCKIIIIII